MVSWQQMKRKGYYKEMMAQSIEQFLVQLDGLDIKLWVEAGQLRFRAPQGRLTGTLRGQISARKEEMIACLQQAYQTQKIAIIHPVTREEQLPLSWAQQRLWFNQTTNRVSSYNVIATFRLEGKLDLPALEQSLDALLDRHEVLRTIFPSVDGTPRQVITEAAPVKLVPIDLQNLPATEQNATIEGLIRQEVLHLYDLATGPLVRIQLAKQTNECHAILFSFHHILIDAGSLAQIFDELGSLYNAYTTDTPSPLPRLALQYADYAYWQRHSLTPAMMEARVNYWVERLTRETPLFELYRDKPRPVTETFRGSIMPFQMTVAQTDQLKALQSSLGATLFSSVLAAWTALLYRYGEGEELVVGSPFSNRTHQELEGVIGHWSSLLLLPLRFQGNPTFLEIVQQVKQATQDAIANDVPIDQLIEALPAARKRNNLPHQFLLSFLPGSPTNSLKLSGLTVTPIEKKTNMLRPDLGFMIWEDQNSLGSSLAGHWVYKIELLEEESVVRMMEDFHSLLNALLADPTCAINDVELPHLRQFSRV